MSDAPRIVGMLLAIAGSFCPGGCGRPESLPPGKGLTAGGQTLTLHLRRQEATRDQAGHRFWNVVTEARQVPANETAIIICDVWDKHWSRGANERVAAMAPRMNEVVKAARRRGATIIHAPSETMSFYADAPARLRVKDAPPVQPPKPLLHGDPPMPVDASDGGSDTNWGDEKEGRAWTRQIAAIEIDQQRDGISDSGQEIYSFLQSKGIRHVIIMGVHTNMCILNRSFAIKQMVRWGMDTVLCRDLTDAMYNPARPPYVNHEEGTRLVVEYIEKFWCPTIASDDLIQR